MEQNKNLRNLVLNMLEETLDRGRFSHVVLNEAFCANHLSVQEKKFVSNLYLGTLEQLVLLDTVLNRYSKTRTEKMKPVIRNLLRSSVYQLLFMDGVPARAVLAESQKLCSRRHMDGLKPFVNGVLRTIERNKETCRQGLPDYAAFAVPEWIFSLVTKEYGTEQAAAYFNAVNRPKKGITARLIGVKTEMEAEALLSGLQKEGCKAERIVGLPAVKLSGFETLTGLSAFQEGRLFVQDISSILVSECITEAEMRGTPFVIDVCAAPGGKSIGLADRFPQSRILSLDLSEQKTALIEENITRLHITNLTTRVQDAREAIPDYTGAADVVICDLPCSGLGVIGHKPDIRYRLKETDIPALAALQRQILAACAAYVKPGGILLYSTCTITAEENWKNADWFAQTQDFTPVSLAGCVEEALLTAEQAQTLPSGRLQLLNGINDMDGFFVAKFQKRG